MFIIFDLKVLFVIFLDSHFNFIIKGLWSLQRVPLFVSLFDFKLLKLQFDYIFVYYIKLFFRCDNIVHVVKTINFIFDLYILITIFLILTLLI